MRGCPVRARGGAGPGLLVAAALTGCKNDQGLAPFSLDSVAVIAGDFDRSEEVLSRLGVPATTYEGYIVGPTTEVEDSLDPLTPTVEALLLGTDAEGEPELARHDAIFFNSGVRGLGAQVYNGQDADDALVGDAEVLANVVAWVEGGGVLVASDWAYDLVEEGWPEAVAFLGEEDGLDGAQLGLSEQVVATVEDPALADSLGTSTLQLSFDYSYWAVMGSAGADTTVHLRGDVAFRVDEADGSADLPAVPLLVSFAAGRGRVVLSSFHWRAQKAAVADLLLPAVVEGLPLGAATGEDDG